MDNVVTTDDLIESLIIVTHGASDQHTQQLYRQSLQILVELAKIEERLEASIDLPVGARQHGRLAH